MDKQARMLAYAGVCWRMLTYAGKNASLFAYGQTGTYADVCWRMLTYADVCYGQTGSGKTHTIFGPNREAGAHVMLLDAGLTAIHN
jgi:hypothetical protein